MENSNQAFDIPQEAFETIEKYVLGEMSGAEISAFKHKIAVDKTLAEQVEEVETLISGSREAAMRIKLDQFHQNLPAEEGITKTLNSSSNRSKRYFLAAAIAVLFASSIWFFLTQQQEQANTFAQFYEVDPGLITRMSTDQFYEFNRGMVDYKSGKYTDAINAWTDLHTQNQGSDTLNYFLGSAFLANKQGKQAIPYFEAILPQEKSSFYSDALWYLALAHVLIEDYPKAQEYLEQSSHPEKEALLIQLKNDL